MQENLAEVLKQGEVCEMNLKSKTKALNVCRADLINNEPMFFEKPEFIIGGFVLSFSVGALFMASKCFGYCK